MSKMKVMFKDLEEVNNFVNIIKTCPYDIDLSRGKFIVDAKSILGVINLGLHNEIFLNAPTDAREHLKLEIGQYLTA
ncbi:MAG: HPr family phosphocarrier protein [Eubacteriales bacterium]